MSDESFLKECEEALERARKELDAATQQRLAAHERENALFNEVKGWEQAVDALRRRMGISGVSAPQAPRASEQAGASPPGATQTKPEPGLNVTEFVRRVILRAGAHGVTPKDVATAIREAGFQAHPNYAYAVIDRLKRRAEIVERNGRYAMRGSMGEGV